MSVASSVMSTMSVSINGQEMMLETALDDTFKQLQSTLNGLHCSTRECCMVLDQDASFEDMVEKGDEISDGIDMMLVIFKELRTIIKQVMLKPETDEEKQWLKTHIEQKKLTEAAAKLAI